MASTQAKQRMSRAQQDRRLTLKQKRFVQAYARTGNGTQAAKQAGYSDSSPEVLSQQATDNLRKPHVFAAVEQEEQRIAQRTDYGAGRVLRRLDRLSHGAEGEGQFGVAVRAEELLGKAAGMFVDQSLHLTANLSGDHLAALLEVARQRQAQPIVLGNAQGERK